MYKELEKLVSEYTKYLEAIKKEDCNIKAEYLKIKKLIKATDLSGIRRRIPTKLENYEKGVDNWDTEYPKRLKMNIRQDAYINCMLANHDRHEAIEPSFIIEKLINTKFSDETMDWLELQMLRTFSWLPTLYKYFSPKCICDLVYMIKELEVMLNESVVSKDDKALIWDNILAPCKGWELRKVKILERGGSINASTGEIHERSKYSDEEISKKLKPLKDEYFNRIEEEMNEQNMFEYPESIIRKALKDPRVDSTQLALKLEDILKSKLSSTKDHILHNMGVEEAEAPNP